jgi:amino acid adenylation domain-containing protein
MGFDDCTLGFLQHARTDPERVALADDRCALSYADLRARALSLAGRLTARGLAAGDVVAILCDRSVESVVAIVGVLCAGAAYLPLDSSYPPARIVDMLDDAKPRLVVRAGEAAIEASQLGAWKVVEADAADDALPLSEPVTVDAGMPAYVLFTSGSTGRPKGVVVSRGALRHMVAWHTRHPRLGRPARALQFASLAFDASVRDLFATLACGGTLVMAAEQDRRDPFRLLEIMRTQRVERASLPYVALRAIAQAHAQGGVLPDGLRDVSSGGEVLTITPAIRGLFEVLSDAVLYNEYGPTEACVLVTSHVLSGDPAQWPVQPDIGQALPHARMLVVDERLQPVSDDVEGELLIGGPTLAVGYINRPDLTAERFVQVTGSDGSLWQMYRSGDRMRRFPDGHFEFVGRVDDQVKIAGNRVEPAEIESALAAHAAVREAAVVAPQGSEGRYLVACMVLAGGISATERLRDELKAHLAMRLPTYARPQRLVFRDELPLTPNGKVDRRRLEAECAQAVPASPSPGAGSARERQVVGLWRQLLSMPELAIDDNVFEHGADSLQVMMFVTRLRAATGGMLGAATVYELPTSRLQAMALSGATPPDGTMTASVPGNVVELPLEVPLSESQMEKWFASQFGETASLAFNEASTLQLDGMLDVGAFQRALATVWQRHEVFRFSFAADGTCQHFNAGVSLPLTLLDYSSPAEDSESRLDAFHATQMAQPFDMTKPPLLRFTLIRMAEHRHVLHVMAHHLVMDGWSLAILVTELSDCYNAYLSGSDPALARAGSFRRYLIAERKRRAEGSVAASLAYWTQLYAVPPSALRLPADRPAPVQPDYVAGTEQYELSPSLTGALRHQALQRNVSFYSLLLSGFAVMLARLSGQDDFTIAVPFAGLALAGDEVLMGDGVSALPLRMRVASEVPLGDLIARTHAALMDAAEHQDVTLTAIQRALGLHASGGEAALSGVTFSMLPRAPLTFEGLSHVLRESSRAALDWDISFTVMDTGATLAFNLHYARERYDATTMRRWMGYYETVLSTISALDNSPGSTDVAVDDIDLLDGAGRDEVLRQWNATNRDYDRAQSLTALVEEQMSRTPERIAVECNARQMDYAVLERRTRALAQALGRRGIGRGDMVGVCVPRSLDMLVAVLGVLRSGAAYVPLDPEFPDVRLRHMAEHSRLRHVLMSELDLVPTVVASGRELLAVADLCAEPTDRSPLPEVHGDDLAYVLFTSGSTGEPKGVRILHRNLVNFLLSMRVEPGFGPDDVLCAVTTLSFDIAGLELYLPLICGGRLVIATESLHREPTALFELLERTRCTVLQTTPSLLQLLQGIGHEDVVRQLRLFVGGEALPLPLAHAMAGQCREFWNLYGPTETTIWSTVARIRPDMQAIPLGTSIANTRIYVLDAQGRPVPPGVIGEIWIGGDGVSDGYLFRPELTAERFVDDPFTGGDARMYRTGDLGNQREGVLYFHGRADNQIKIRGYRIEPGDIEAAAGVHPDIHECVAVARRFGDNDVRLVLYVVTDRHDQAFAEHLRELLRQRLPAYMRPQHIEQLEALPKTPNGKIDRHALPLPAVSKTAELPSMSATDSMRAPVFEDRRQAYLASVWCELVGVKNIRSNDNFFDIGGHSLLAVEFTTRVHRETGVRLSLLAVATSTLASLATELSEESEWSNGATGRTSASLRERLRRLWRSN